jgi:uncharacterized membrane protein YdcZ (DUF606 family)
VTLGLSAALRLALGKPDGVVLVSGDRASTASSFWAIAFCLPSVICRLLMTWVATGIPPHAAHLAARELVVFVVGWLVFVEVTHRLAGPMGRADRWGRFIALWNWCNVVEGVLVVAGLILGAPEIGDEACQLVTIGWAVWLEWYATKLTFGVGATSAVGFVLLDQAIGIMLASLAIMVSS